MSIPYNSPYKVSITVGTVIKAVFVLLALYVCYIIKDILAILFVSLILASAIDPWVDKMQSWKVPRAIGVSFIYLVATVVIGLVIYLLIPPITQQFSSLSENFPQYVEKVSTGYNFLRDFSIKYGVLDKIKTSIGSLEEK